MPFPREIKLPVDPPNGSAPPGAGKALLTWGFKYRSPTPGLVAGKYSARAAPVGSGGVAHWKLAWNLNREPADRGRETGETKMKILNPVGTLGSVGTDQVRAVLA